MKVSSAPCIATTVTALSLFFPFLFPTLSPSGKGRTFQELPSFPLAPYGRSRRASVAPKQGLLELGPFRKDPKCARKCRETSTSVLRPRAVPSVGGVGQRLQRWQQEAAAASTSPKTGATFKEGAE
ncbi:hypothetical protein HJG60_012195 [Phyllostomus discolor]|uniref:Uncharacterized protein n=1 Tax=Phyllostomus discolor TaxID=89673 RepID=A0A833ZE41_9CHIR|nr:hypothetical protein HJG60_012195 [Phyllostomus discolor]